MTEPSEQAETHTPPSKSRWWWHRHLWAVLAIWSTMFMANEGVRIYTQRQITESSDVFPATMQEIRFSTFEKDQGPTLLPQFAEAIAGKDWNQDIVSIDVFGDDRPLETNDLARVARLKRLSILKIDSARLSQADVDRVAGIKSLQWLVLRQTGLDRDAIVELRERMPNTFVSYFP